MRRESLHYPLVDGYIHHWLVAGPQSVPIESTDQFSNPQDKAQIVQQYYQSEIGLEGKPIEYGDCELGDFKSKWKYFLTRHDHLVDLSAFYPSLHYLRAWAYTEIDSPTEQEVTLILTTNGPADLWLNGQHIHRQERFYHKKPGQEQIQTLFKAGANRLMIRLEEVAARECPYSMALRIVDFKARVGAEEKVVRIPTCAPDPQRRLKLETLFEACHVRQDVFTKREPITAFLYPPLAADTDFIIRLQSPGGSIYAEANRNKRIEVEQVMGYPYQSPEGSYQLRFMPPPLDFYEGNIRITRTRDFYASTNVYSTHPYGTYQERRTECLMDAARRKDDLFSEIAKMEGGWWKNLEAKVVSQAIEEVNRHGANSDIQLCGLLGMLYRYADKESFPADLRQPIEECVLGFRYGDDESGSAMMALHSESHSILFHTCEILAGQLYPERIFTSTSQPGQWHHTRGERLALEWLQRRTGSGFEAWDSNTCFEEDILALSTLTSLADNQQIWEMAAVVMDKMFFTIAINSFKGVFGSTHGHAYAQHIKTGYREPTSGITRLLWGMGIFNEHTAGPVSLACSTYELPPIIAAIAADQPDEFWSQEQHAVGDDVGTAINKVTYKTPDAMLCSAQDWRPGEDGDQEHIWQATLSPAVTVFTSHPACTSEGNARHPGYWHGNATLPRVAQWKDTLIAIYNFDGDDWMGFTHAYFPVYGMDEHEIRDGWAFGRVDDGYIALAAAQGLDFQKYGDNAYRDLCSPGTPNIWLCLLGREALDGSFSTFVDKVLALPVKFEGTQVELTTLRGDQLSFAWEGALLVNGETQPLSGFKHYDNPYCTCEMGAAEMEIRYGIDALRLHFEENLEEEPGAQS
jgi:hypothetical protein